MSQTPQLCMVCYRLDTPGHPCGKVLQPVQHAPTLSDTRGIWCSGCNASIPLGAVHTTYCTKRTQHPAEDKRTEPFPMNDAVNHPKHYTSHPSGVECIKVTEHMNFCRGNAVKYIWRAGEKGNEIEDLKKARWYVDREIARLESATK